LRQQETSKDRTDRKDAGHSPIIEYALRQRD
jgi:hypothetical protein